MASFYSYSETDEYTIEILANIEFAGAIIGRKGSNIRRMEKQSNATIRLDDGPLSDPGDSLITISGTWDSIEKAVGLLTETVSSYSTDDFLTFKLIVHKNQCGRIIGSGGHKIRKIEDSTGASLFISSDQMTDRKKKKVVIDGDAESISSCIMEILEIVIECPVTERSSSGNQAQSSQVSPTSYGSSTSSSVTLNPAAFTGQSTSASATLSNNQNSAGPSSAGTPQARAVSSVDCHAFGELVTSEMQKLNTQRQSQLRSEILASIAKFKKAEADSRLNEALDDCSICLETVKNKTFVGECLHVFCYNCIEEWIKMKSTCPICVGEIKSLLHNIRSNDDYDVYKFPDPQPRSREGTPPYSAFVGLGFFM